MNIIDLIVLTLPEPTWWNTFFHGHGHWIIANEPAIRRASKAATYHATVG